MAEATKQFIPAGELYLEASTGFQVLVGFVKGQKAVKLGQFTFFESEGEELLNLLFSQIKSPAPQAVPAAVESIQDAIARGAVIVKAPTGVTGKRFEKAKDRDLVSKILSLTPEKLREILDLLDGEKQ